jgi:general secretion pathway protein N
MRMTRLQQLIAAGLAAFFVTVLASIPAGVVVRWLGPEWLRVSGISGSLWHGTARSIEAGGLRLGRTDWELLGWSVLLGRLSGRVESRFGDGVASGDVAIRLGGGFDCTACRYEGALSNLWPVVAALRSVEGRMVAEIPTLQVRNGWPTRAVATVHLSGVSLPLSADVAALQPQVALVAQVASDPVDESGIIEAEVKDDGGPVELAATLAFSPPGAFTLSGRVKARAGAPADLVNALNLLGPRDSGGTTQVSLSGTF